MNLKAIYSLLLAGQVLVAIPAASAQPLGPDFSDLSAAVLPTTVHVRVERGPLISSGIQQLARDFAIPTPRANQGAVKISTGSGVIFAEEGFVLTNHHVINGAQRILVTLYDQRTFEATVVGSDPRTDVAVLQISGDAPFDAASVGDSSQVSVGEWVVAVGHPFDFPFTVTAGIVSALGRRGLGHNEIQDYIQTDVAVNPGSSGGPLFNTEGEVIGINTAIFSPDKENLASAGISFAIPSAMAMSIGSKLMAGESIAAAGIGVQTVDSPASVAEPRLGVRVTRVLAGSPAEAAGLRRSDIIFTVNGEPVPNSRDFQGTVQSFEIGTKLHLGFKRGKKDRVTSVKSVDAASIGSSAKDGVSGEASWAGLTLGNTSPDMLHERGIALPSDVSTGVMVVSVSADSPGAMAGLLPGDVLLQVSGQSIETVDELLSTVENHGVVLVSFWRGKNRYLAALANRVKPD